MESKTPLLIYHRGRHGKGIRCKENTIGAFECAIKEGARMIEFDVWTGLRVTHDQNPSIAVPTLEEVLDAIHARCAVNIEIKSPQAAESVMGVIDDALTLGCWRSSQIVVSSFHHKTAITMKQQFPRLRVGVINVGVVEPYYIDWLGRQNIDNLHLAWESVSMDIEDGCRMRCAAHVSNMHIWIYTVNTKEIFDMAVKYGAEAIFTDKPQLFR